MDQEFDRSLSKLTIFLHVLMFVWIFHLPPPQVWIHFTVELKKLRTAASNKTCVHFWEAAETNTHLTNFYMVDNSTKCFRIFMYCCLLKIIILHQIVKIPNGRELELIKNQIDRYLIWQLFAICFLALLSFVWGLKAGCCLLLLTYQVNYFTFYQELSDSNGIDNLNLVDQRSLGYAYRSQEGDVERTLKTVETGVGGSHTAKVRTLIYISSLWT